MALDTVIVTVLVCDVEHEPVITPVAGSNVTPAGNPVALNFSGAAPEAGTL